MNSGPGSVPGFQRIQMVFRLLLILHGGARNCSGERKSMTIKKIQSKPEIPGPEDIISAGEVADLFRVAPGTVNRWEQTGKLMPAFRTLGGHRRYRRADIMALIDSLQEYTHPLAVRRKNAAHAPEPESGQVPDHSGPVQ